jgi:glutathione S-transferase
MAELLHLSYSPWSEKARWALDVCGVPHARRGYQVLFGELELRLLLRRARGVVSVPLLRAGSRVFGDSFAIAEYADANSRGAKLFPPGSQHLIARYDELSERGLRAGRALSLARVVEDDEALLELVPRPVRSALGARAVDMARFGVKRTLRKYGADRQSLEAHERALCEVLDVLRADLERSSSTSVPKTLLPEFSYADVTMAQVLAFVSPPSALRMGPATRRAFHDTRVAALYPDLLAWRDALYVAHRKLHAK